MSAERLNRHLDPSSGTFDRVDVPFLPVLAGLGLGGILSVHAPVSSNGNWSLPHSSALLQHFNALPRREDDILT